MSAHILFRYLELVIPTAAQFVVMICNVYEFQTLQCSKSLLQVIQRMQHALINHMLEDFQDHLYSLNYWVAQLSRNISARGDPDDTVVLELLAIFNGHMTTQFDLVKKLFPKLAPTYDRRKTDLASELQLLSAIRPESTFGGHIDPAFLAVEEEIRLNFMRIGEELDTVIAHAVENLEVQPDAIEESELEFLDIERAYALRDRYLIFMTEPEQYREIAYKTFQELVALISFIGRTKNFSYYTRFHPTYVNSKVPGHFNCAFCKVGFVHCFYSTNCSNLGDCQAHRMLDKNLFDLNLNSKFAVKLRVMLNEYSEDDLYDAFTEPHNRDYVTFEYFSASLRLLFEKFGLTIFRPVINNLPNSDEFQPCSFVDVPHISKIVEIRSKIRRLISERKIEAYPERFVDFLSILLSGHLTIAARYSAEYSLEDNIKKFLQFPANPSKFINSLIDAVFFTFRKGRSIDIQATIARIRPAVETIQDCLSPISERGVTSLMRTLTIGFPESDDESDDEPVNQEALNLFRRLRDAVVVD